MVGTPSLFHFIKCHVEPSTTTVLAIQNHFLGNLKQGSSIYSVLFPAVVPRSYKKESSQGWGTRHCEEPLPRLRTVPVLGFHEAAQHLLNIFPLCLGCIKLNCHHLQFPYLDRIIESFLSAFLVIHGKCLSP